MTDIRIALDERRGLLRLDLGAPPLGFLACALDDEEVFVFTDSETGRPCAFVIHAIRSHWADRLDALSAHLAGYGATVPSDLLRRHLACPREGP